MNNEGLTLAFLQNLSTRNILDTIFLSRVVSKIFASELPELGIGKARFFELQPHRWKILGKMQL
jgi:hypothetical protein